MLKNRSVQVKIVKDEKNPATPELEAPKTQIDPDYVAEKAVELGTLAVKGVVVVMVAYLASDTLRQVIVKTAPTR